MIRVQQVWRYPVKAMAGESLGRVEVDARGLAGDRWLAVVDAEGRFASFKNTRRFRRHDAMSAYAAGTGPGGVVVTRGEHQWAATDPALVADLGAELGVPVRLEPEAGVPHQDAGQVSLVGTASLAWCREHLGVDADPRRLRVNLVVETHEPFAEEGWLGREVTVGGVRLAVAARIERCRTIDLAQNGAAGTTAWLTALAGERELCLGVYADVRSRGEIGVGDAVHASR